MATWSPMGDVPNPMFDTNGDPADGFVLKAYLPGGTTSTSMAIDSAGASPQTSITANADGIWEVGNAEVVPHIDRTHKWGIFENAANAAANTPFYMGSMDDIDQVSTISDTTVATYAAIKAITGQSDNESIVGLGRAAEGDGGAGSWRFDSGSSATDNNATILQPDSGTGRWHRNFNGPLMSLWFATGDTTTDDLAAFDAFAAAAITEATNHIFIEALGAGLHYNLSTTWTLTEYDDFWVDGGGPQALVFGYDEAGNSVIDVDSCIFMTMSNFAVSSVLGGSSGLVLTNASNFFSASNLWFQHFDDNCIKVVKAIGGRWNQIICNINGHNIGLPSGGKSTGNSATGNGIFVAGQASGGNHDHTFINCEVNANYGTGSDDFAFRVGDASNQPQAITWFGGILQGGTTANLALLHTKYSLMTGFYSESPPDATNYDFTLKKCTNTYINYGLGSGDILFDDDTTRCGMKGRTCHGINIDSSCSQITLEDMQLLNASSGPAGNIRDFALDTRFINCTGGPSTATISYTVGEAAPGPLADVASIHMEDWRGSDASPTLPAGLDNFNVGTTGLTISRSTTQVHTGTYSAKLVTDGVGSGFQAGLMYKLPITGTETRTYYVVTANVWVETGTASLRGWIGGGAVVDDYTSTGTGKWQRMVVTIKPTASHSNYKLMLTLDLNSTVYWGSVTIQASNFSPVNFKTASDIAIPEISTSDNGSAEVHGVPIQTVLVTGATAITDLIGLWPGIAVRLLFDAAKLVTHNASILKLFGARDFLAAAGDTLDVFLNPVDGIIYETGRTVLAESLQTLTGAGAVGLTTDATHIVTTGTDALTLADGTAGQWKVIVAKDISSGVGTLTPTNLANGTSAAYDTDGDSGLFYFTNSAWHFMGGSVVIT